MPNLVLPEAISQKIYLIRGHKVMIDKELANLYSVPIKRLNEQVKRNKKRFPEDFMFQLTENETVSLRSQIACKTSITFSAQRQLFFPVLG